MESDCNIDKGLLAALSLSGLKVEQHLTKDEVTSLGKHSSEVKRIDSILSHNTGKQLKLIYEV